MQPIATWHLSALHLINASFKPVPNPKQLSCMATRNCLKPSSFEATSTATSTICYVPLAFARGSAGSAKSYLTPGGLHFVSTRLQTNPRLQTLPTYGNARYFETPLSCLRLKGNMFFRVIHLHQYTSKLILFFWAGKSPKYCQCAAKSNLAPFWVTLIHASFQATSSQLPLVGKNLKFEWAVV